MKRASATSKSTQESRVDRRRALSLLGGLLPATYALSACATAGGSQSAAPSATPRAGTIRRSYVDARYGQMHVYRSDPSVARHHPLLCFHPTAMAGDYYRDFMQHIGTDRVVLAVDSPGYGKSDRPEEPQPMSGLAGATADVLDALGYGANGSGPVDAIGYHTGTYVALELAILRPDLVRRLVLPGIPFFNAADSKERLESNTQQKTVSEYEKAIHSLFRFWVVNRGEGISADRGIAHFAEHLQAGLYYQWAYQAVFGYPAEERLALVQQPVLIPNFHDGLEENSRQAGEIMPNATVTEYPDISKRPFANAADRVAEITRAFLDS